MCQKISLADISIFIIRVSAHQKDNSEVIKFNNQVDKLTKKTNEAKMPKIYFKIKDSWLMRKSIQIITLNKQERQWNIKSEYIDTPIDRSHHQTLVHSTRTWLEKRNIWIPTKYLQFQIKIYENCCKCKAWRPLMSTSDKIKPDKPFRITQIDYIGSLPMPENKPYTCPYKHMVRKRITLSVQEE